MLDTLNKVLRGQTNASTKIQKFLTILLNEYASDEASFFLTNDKLKVIGNVIIDSGVTREAENQDLQIYLDKGLAGWV